MRRPCLALATRMFARTRPRSNAGQLRKGPKLVVRVLPSPKSEDEVDKYPTDPNSETRGKRSAIATPTRAVSACNAYSAKRTSARLRSKPAGSPISRTCGRGGSSASRRERLHERSGRFAEQHGKAMRAAVDVALERRNARERRFELRSRTRDVEVGAAAAGEQRLRELERLPLVLGVSLRDGQSVAGAFELEVGSRELRRDDHERIAQRLRRRVGVRGRRLHGAPNATEEIELPRGIERHVVHPLVAVRRGPRPPRFAPARARSIARSRSDSARACVRRAPRARRAGSSPRSEGRGFAAAPLRATRAGADRRAFATTRARARPRRRRRRRRTRRRWAKVTCGCS